MSVEAITITACVILLTALLVAGLLDSRRISAAANRELDRLDDVIDRLRETTDMKPVQVINRYQQEADDMQPTDAEQILEISTEDGGAGPYLVIKTDRWAIDPDDIEELVERLRNVLAMVRDAGEPNEGGDE